MGKIVFLFTLLVLWELPVLGKSCYSVGERLKIALGIEGEYDPRLRVERKTTNTREDAKNFMDFIRSLSGRRKGETFELRDKPSSSKVVLVTSTNYPFAKKVIDQFNVKVRIREYGERAKGSKDPFTSTTGEFVTLELKAKLPEGANPNRPEGSNPNEVWDGVVVKPMLKFPKSLLADVFTSSQSFQKNSRKIAETLIELNSAKVDNIEGVVKEAMKDLADMHALQAKIFPGQKIPCRNVEYERQAFVLLVANAAGETRKVQLTFDYAVAARDGVNAAWSPHQIGKIAPDGKYPPDSVVIEMKSDLWVNGEYLKSPQALRQDYPTYYLVRRAYEKLQELSLDNFDPNRGKAAHFRRNQDSLREFIHFYN